MNITTAFVTDNIALATDNTKPDTVYFWSSKGWRECGEDTSSSLRNVVIAYGILGYVAVLGRRDIGPPKGPPTERQISVVQLSP